MPPAPPNDPLATSGALALNEQLAALGARQTTPCLWWGSTLGARNTGLGTWWPRVQAFAASGHLPPPVLSWRPVWIRVVSRGHRMLRLVTQRLRWRWWWRRQQLRTVDTVIITHFQVRSFGPARNDYRDPYFEPLLARFRAAGITHALVGLATADEHAVRQRLHQRDPAATPLLPLAHFNRLVDLGRAFWHCWRARLEVPPEVPWRGRNLAQFCTEQFAQDRRDGTLFDNLLHYYALRRLLRQCPARRILWPWENHSWERLLITAHHDLRHPARLLGYQHSSLPPLLFNQFPARAELPFAPYPHRLITTGPRSLALLAQLGHFPPGCLVAGCALRHAYLADHLAQPPRPRSPRLRRLGVALSLVTADSGHELLAQVAAATASGDWQVQVRCHPLRPAAVVFKDHPLPAGMTLAPAESLPEFISHLDVMLYSVSSVGFDGLALGVPIIFLGAPAELSGDPLFACNALRWQAYDAATLRTSLQAVAALSDTDYAAQQADARRYVSEYLAPITPAGLDVFLTA